MDAVEMNATRSWRLLGGCLLGAVAILAWFGVKAGDPEVGNVPTLPTASLTAPAGAPAPSVEPDQVDDGLARRRALASSLVVDPNLVIPPLMEAALARKRGYDESPPPAGRQIVSDPKDFSLIADPIDALLTATSAEDAKWMEEYGWPLPEELRVRRNPDQACYQIPDWSTLKDDNLCAHALYQRGTVEDLEHLDSLASSGSSFAARLRVLAELAAPKTDHQEWVVRRMILAGMLAGDGGIRAMAPRGIRLQYTDADIVSAQRRVASAADYARWTGNPIAFRARPQPTFVVSVDAEGRLVTVPVRP